MPSTGPPNFPQIYGLLESTKGNSEVPKRMPVWDTEQRPCTEGPAVSGIKEIQKTETSEQKCLLYFGDFF